MLINAGPYNEPPVAYKPARTKAIDEAWFDLRHGFYRTSHPRCETVFMMLTFRDRSSLSHALIVSLGLIQIL